LFVVDVDDHLAEDDLEADFVFIFFDEGVGVVGSVEIFTVFFLVAGAGVVSTDDEVGASVVFSDEGVPDGFAGTGHAHGEG